MPKYNINIHVGEVEAENVAAAYDKALKLLDSLAGSNDGSEVLANATPVITEA